MASKRPPLVAAVVDAWRPLAAHGHGCSVCESVVAELRQVPDDPYPHRDRLCPVGVALYDPWTEAKLALIGLLKASAKPWGTAGLPEPEAQERAAAIGTLTDVAAREIFEDPDDDRREAKIRAVIAAYRAQGSATTREPERPASTVRQCANPGCAGGRDGGPALFPIPKHAPNKRFCSDSCRQSWRAAHDAATRPSLTPTQ